MNTIILADNFQKGMKSQGCVGLIEYSKKHNLIQQQSKSIRSVFPQSKIFYVYGFDHKRFNASKDKNNIENITYVQNENYDKYNHGHSLLLALSKIDKQDDCLIMFGYDAVDVKTIRNIKRTRKSAAIIDPNTKSKLGCILDATHNKISHIFFDLDNHISNIFFLRKTEFQILNNIAKNNNISHLFLFEIINMVISSNGTLEPMVIQNV